LATIDLLRDRIWLNGWRRQSHWVLELVEMCFDGLFMNLPIDGAVKKTDPKKTVLLRGFIPIPKKTWMQRRLPKEGLLANAGRKGLPPRHIQGL